MTDSILDIRDLRVSFPTPNGDVQAVRGVDLSVQQGELLAVVGESGSGKSVTFLGVMGLLAPSTVITGSARLGETELIGAAPKVVRRVRGRKIAMIFQDPLSALNPVQRIGMQVVEMIRSHDDMSKSAAESKAVDLLDLVGIPQPRARA